MGPSRATLEMAAIMADGQWHSSRELAASAGKYIRPEIIARAMKRKHYRDQETAKAGYLSSRLGDWRLSGWVESKIEDGITHWRALRTEHFKNYSQIAGAGERKVPVQKVNDLKQSLSLVVQLLEQRLTDIEDRLTRLEQETGSGA